MHILFLHQNFPAQFGTIASRLGGTPGYRCTFLSKEGGGQLPNVERIFYKPASGATERTHFASRTFENIVWQSHAVYEALKKHPDLRPDLIVGHSGFASTLPLRELYSCPIINYFEYFYHTTGSDLDFRMDDPPNAEERIRARFRNAALLLDLHNCDAGYSPTQWQRSRLPSEFHHKINVIFDGVDTTLWYPRPRNPRKAGRFHFPNGIKLVTYAARGLESIRGFDIFMKFANQLSKRRDDVRFVVIGQDRVCYGGDLKRTGGKSFKQWVLSQDTYDLSKFAFLGPVQPEVLAEFFSITDLHVYLTVPFVLSWSLMDALACGATIMASRTAPVCEMIVHEKNGLLVDFFDVEGMVETASRVLDNPESYRPLGQSGTELIKQHYSLAQCLPKLQNLFETTIRTSRGQ
jgi:glycosyltransferase involved in cell wall biosynthesis